MEASISIVLTADGKINFQAQGGNPLVLLGLLDRAKDLLLHPQNAKEGSAPLLVANGCLPRMSP